MVKSLHHLNLGLLAAMSKQVMVILYFCYGTCSQYSRVIILNFHQLTRPWENNDWIGHSMDTYRVTRSSYHPPNVPEWRTTTESRTCHPQK